MTGSRDPIREYMREARRQQHRRILNWVLMIAAAVAFWVMLWAFMVWAFSL